MIALQFLFIIIGVTLVLWGADRLTEGASAIARRLNVPEIVIGLTIVAAGTSAPEMFVSVVSALKGTPDLAIGNVVGSNIFNCLLIVGVASLVAPMTIAKTTVVKDIPFTLMASALLLILCMDGWRSLSLSGNVISRLDGFWLLLGFAAFMYYTFQIAKAGTAEQNVAPPMPIWRGALWLLVGLSCLVLGSNLFVDSASAIATGFGISEGVVGLTIVAGGTSMPELATSVVAARKGKSAMAIGNVIGSNVFNILLILGTTAVICPMQIGGITLIDLGVMLLSVVLIWLFSYTKYTIERWEGGLLTTIFLVYMGWLLYNL